MALNIGNITITEKTEEELKQDGIYCFSDLDDKIIKNIPLDYEFLLVNGENGGIFTEAIECMFLNRKPSPLLKNGAIGKNFRPPENADSSGQESNIGEIIFKWFSRVIERLPGRIIVVGNKAISEENWKKGGGDIQNWLKKRIAWIDCFNEVKVEGLKTEKKEDFKIEMGKPLNSQEIRLLMYNVWLKNFFDVKGYKIVLDFSGSDHGRVMLDFILNRRFEFIYMLSKKFEFDIKPCAFLIPYLCDTDCLPSEQRYRWLQNLKKNNFQNKDIKKDLKRREVIDDDFVKIVSQIILLNNPLKTGEKEELREELREELHVVLKNTGEKNNNLPKIYNVKIEEESNYFEYKEGTGNIIINYTRHGKLEPDRIMINTKDEREYFYIESLTGSSIHFGLLYNTFDTGNHFKKADMFFKLVENGLLRILIADERISEYVQKKEDIKIMYKCAGITAISNLDHFIDNIGNIGVISELKTVENKEPNSVEMKPAFDAFIIHQGILDKTHSEIEKIEDYINMWKKTYFPLIIVTSGRGTPANIPANVRFIPFSALESNLISSSISKLILTNTLIKTLSRRVK